MKAPQVIYVVVVRTYISKTGRTFVPKALYRTCASHLEGKPWVQCKLAIPSNYVHVIGQYRRLCQGLIRTYLCIDCLRKVDTSCSQPTMDLVYKVVDHARAEVIGQTALRS